MLSASHNYKAVANKDIELGNLPALPASTTTSLYGSSEDSAPLIPQTSQVPEHTASDDNTLGSKLIEPTQQLVESSRRRERDAVPDLESNENKLGSLHFSKFDDEEVIWARTKKRQSKRTTVMTDEEMKADPLLIDRLAAKPEFAELEKICDGIWPMLKSFSNAWNEGLGAASIRLQIQLAFFCTVKRNSADLKIANSRAYLDFVWT